jgi:hypothetical protein
LGDPASDRMLGHAGEEDLATLEIDEEQDIEPSQPHGVDREDIARERSRGVCSEECAPRRARSSWCWFESVTSKHVAHARRRDDDTELCAFTHNAEIAPPGILKSETKVSATAASPSAL